MASFSGRLLAVAVAFASGFSIATPSRAAAPAVHASGDYRFTVADVPEFVNSTPLPAEWPKTAPGAAEESWRVWRFESQVDRRAERVRRFVDYAYEARSQELAGEAAKLQLDFNPEFQQLTLHAVELRRDGRWSSRLAPAKITLARRESGFENDMADGVVTALVVMDDVRAGDVLRVRYSVDGDNPILGGQSRESLTFGWSSPMLRARLRVLFPPGSDIVEFRDPGAPEGRRSERADAIELDYVQENLARVVDEKIYPVGFRPSPLVEVAERRDWADVVAWALPLYPAPQPLPASLQARIAQWKALPDVDARIAAALRAVQEEVRYFGIEIGDSTHKPAEPALTWERRFGDCKDKVRLLVAVLAELGVQARPALVSARNGKQIAPRPPSAVAFDHVIAQVLLEDGTSLWLDPTVTQQRGSPRAMTVGDFGLALPVAPGVESLVEIKRPAAARDRTRVIEHLGKQEGDAFDFTVESRYEGDAADRLRRSAQSQGRENMARAYAEYYRRRFGAVEAVGELEIDDREADNTLIVREAYRVPQPWAASSGGQHAFEAYPQLIGEYAGLPAVLDRKAPLPVSFPVEIEHVTRIHLPKDWRWVDPPSEKTLGDEALRFELRPRLKDQQIELVHRYEAKRDIVEVPALGKHLALRRSIGETIGARVILAMPAADAARQREQRLNSLMQGLMDKQRKPGSRASDDD